MSGTNSKGRQPYPIEWGACSSKGNEVIVSALKNPYNGSLFQVEILDPITRTVVAGEDIDSIQCCPCPIDEQQVCQFYAQSFMGNNSISIAASKVTDAAIYDVIAGANLCPVGAPRAVTFLVSLYVDGCAEVYTEEAVGPIAVSPTGITDFEVAFNSIVSSQGFEIEWGDTFSATGILGYKITNPSDRDWWILIRDRFDDHAGGLCTPVNNDFWIIRSIDGVVEDVLGAGATPADPFTFVGSARPAESCA